MFLKCQCGKIQQCEVLEVVPSEEFGDYVDREYEYVKHIPECVHCKKSSIEVVLYDQDKKAIYCEKLSKRKKERYLSKMIVLAKTNLPKRSAAVSKSTDGWEYSEYGKVKLCFQWLSTLRIGLFDPDEGLQPNFILI